MAYDLQVKEFECLLLHGDMEQAERNKVITAFKKQECHLLVRKFDAVKVCQKLPYK